MSLDIIAQYPEWHHIQLWVKDVDVSIRFYTEYMGLTEIMDKRDGDGKRWVWLRALENPGAPMVLLREELTEAKSASAAFVRLGFRVASMEKVEEWSLKALQENCLVSPAKDGGAIRGYFCLVQDPDGYLVEFSCPSPDKPSGTA